MKTVDARGHLCPMPIIMLKSAMTELTEPTDMQVLTDNEISKNNLLAFFRDNNITATWEQKEGYWAINATAVNKISASTAIPESLVMPATAPTQSIATPSAQDYTIVLKNNKMGLGNDDLGEILLKGFFNAIAEVNPLPKRMIFYNNGATLVTKTSPFAESIKKLHEKGVDIIICGACVDFFGIKNDIAVGTISNMYAICELLAKTEKVIYP